MKTKVRFLEKYKKWLVVGGGLIFLLIIISIPIVLQKLVIENAYPSKASNDGWISFFGSYLGGVIGGVATLMAVIITINNGKKEREERITQEKEKIIQKSGLIVYYDFKFAFANIHDFMIPFWQKRQTDWINKLEEGDITAFIESRKKFDQFYFDDDWIKTVANLYDSSLLELNDIKKIYEVYGHLMTIKKCIDPAVPVNVEILKNAYTAMNGIMDFTIQLVNNALPDYTIKADIKVVMDKLEKIITDSICKC